jgi:hypothetical protein
MCYDEGETQRCGHRSCGAKDSFPGFKPLVMENILEMKREGMGSRNPHQVMRGLFFETDEKMVNSRILR